MGTSVQERGSAFLSNYTAVTLLLAVNKIFEQLLCYQLRDKFETIFENSTSACRKSYSRETTLIRLVEDWKYERDTGETVTVLSTDILLLAKLKANGFSESALNLMKSYFDGRENRSRVGTATSSWKEIKRGRPQGSSLGPMLWNIYRNDLFYIQREIHLSVYADDDKFYYAHKDPDQAVMVINNDRRQTSRWYSENFLQGNPSKYQATILSNDSSQRDVQIYTFIVQPMDEVNLLGVLIDRNLLFSNHVSTACKKAGMRVSK